MPKYSPKNLLTQVLTATASDSDYTVPANTQLIITGITLKNPTAAAVAVVCRITPSGGSALTYSPTYAVMAGESLAWYDLDNQVLNAGDVIDFTGAGVNVIMSGYLLPV